MFAHRGTLFKGLLTLVCACVLIVASGCGEDEAVPTTTAGAESTGPDPSTTEPEADTADADPADLEVIEEWSSALSEGDVEAAASYFATPSTAENGPVLIEIESIEDAVTFNTSLPCAAEVLSAETDGELTTATFRLSERPGGGCGQGSGGEASTSFRIEDGKIIEWRRVDLPPGAPGGSDGPSPGDPV